MIRADTVPPEVWQAMCTPMHEIIPAAATSSRSRTGALYIGSWAASVDTDLLNTHAIRDVVEVLDSQWATSPHPTPGIGGAAPPTRYKIAIQDTSDADVLKPHIDGAVRHIRDKLAQGQNVLVHCQQGVSRSSAIVIAYLMFDRGMTYDAALRYVKSKRPCVKPNAGFERTLRNWERELRS